VDKVRQRSICNALSAQENASYRLLIRQKNLELVWLARWFDSFHNSLGLLENNENGNRLWWLKLFEANEEDVPSQDEITDIFKHLNRIITDGHFGDVDHLLFVLSDAKMSLELKSSVVRFTYPLREKLSAWKTAVENIKSKIEDKGDNPKDLLFGLI